MMIDVIFWWCIVIPILVALCVREQVRFNRKAAESRVALDDLKRTIDAIATDTQSLRD